MNDQPPPESNDAIEPLPRTEASRPPELPRPSHEVEGYRSEILERLDKWPW